MTRIFSVLVKLRPMLQVRAVATSSRWYQEVLGLRSGHGGDDFEMLFAGDDFVLQLHRLDVHEHPALATDPGAAPGAGVSLWFEAEDRAVFDDRVASARAAGATIVAEPSHNPLGHNFEAALADPDGYVVVLCTPLGSDGD